MRGCNAQLAARLQRTVLVLGVVLTAACEIEPDIIASTVDSGLTSNNNDAGEQCLLGGGMAPVDCQIDVPPSFSTDPTLINVNVMQNNQLIPYGGGLLSEENCSHVVHGWYWVDPEHYTRIAFCPQTCALLDQWQSLFLEFGCSTRPPWLLGPPPGRH